MTAVKSRLDRLPDLVRPAVEEALESATWMKVRRALAAFDSCPVDRRGPEVTIHLVSSFNLESIEPALQLGLRCIPCRPRLIIAPLDTIEQQILNPASSVYKDAGIATIIIWRAEELTPYLFFPLSTSKSGEAADRVHETIERIHNLAHVYSNNSYSPLFLSTLMLPGFSGGTIHDSQSTNGLAASIAKINSEIYNLAGTDSKVCVLDIHRWAAQHVSGVWDIQMDFLARQPFTTAAAISLGFFLARNIQPLLVPRRKVLAVDLDNTLWGGVLGEDGSQNLKLGQDFPGSIYLRIQRQLLELKNQGVLLILASKNDERDVRNTMSELRDMVLTWEDFASTKVNFSPKYHNLREAANELGLGLDSFVFMDDSGFEREQMKQFNPEVLVLNENDNVLHILESLLHTDAFDTYTISDEDKKRHQEYQLRSARAIQSVENVEDFLQSLEMRAELEPVGPSNLERVVQMLGKTNQFNVTTRRHRADEIQCIASTPNSFCKTLRLMDKFGDQGIVALLLAVGSKDCSTVRVDSFLVSCRALNRDVEKVLWSDFINAALAAGIQQIDAEYRPTPKNGIVEKLFDELGMKCIEKVPEGKKYRLRPLKLFATPPWITVGNF